MDYQDIHSTLLKWNEPGSSKNTSRKNSQRQYISKLTNVISAKVPSPNREKRAQQYIQNIYPIQELSLGEAIHDHVDHTYLRNREHVSSDLSIPDEIEDSVDQQQVYYNAYRQRDDSRCQSISMNQPELYLHNYQQSIPFIEACSDTFEEISEDFAVIPTNFDPKNQTGLMSAFQSKPLFSYNGIESSMNITEPKDSSIEVEYQILEVETKDLESIYRDSKRSVDSTEQKTSHPSKIAKQNQFLNDYFKNREENIQDTSKHMRTESGSNQFKETMNLICGSRDGTNSVVFNNTGSQKMEDTGQIKSAKLNQKHTNYYLEADKKNAVIDLSNVSRPNKERYYIEPGQNTEPLEIKQFIEEVKLTKNTIDLKEEVLQIIKEIHNKSQKESESSVNQIQKVSSS